MCKSINGQHPGAVLLNPQETLSKNWGIRHCFADSCRLELGQCVLDRTWLVCHAHTKLRVSHAHGLDSKFFSEKSSKTAIRENLDLKNLELYSTPGGVFSLPGGYKGKYDL